MKPPHRPPSLVDASINAIFYGDSNAGKTFLLGTAQECEATRPLLMIDFNGGMLTLAGRKLDIQSPRSFSEIQDIYDWLRYDNDKYRSVAIDTLTDEQNDLSLTSLLDETDEEGGYTDLGSDTRANQYTWITSAHQMRKFIRAFRGLSYLEDPEKRLHVFMTAHERFSELTMRGNPDIAGAVGVQAIRYVDVMAHLVRRKVKVNEKIVTRRYLHTQDHKISEVLWQGKNRTERLGDGLWEPSIQKLVDLWHQKT